MIKPNSKYLTGILILLAVWALDYDFMQCQVFKNNKFVSWHPK